MNEQKSSIWNRHNRTDRSSKMVKLKASQLIRKEQTDSIKGGNQFIIVDKDVL